MALTVQDMQYLGLQWITSKNLHTHTLLIYVILNDLERP